MREGAINVKFRKIISVLTVMCLLISTVFIPSTVSASTQTDAQTYVDEIMEFYEINGVAYVTKNGKVMCQSARGMANTDESKEMTINTLFPVGSVSKQFCAAAILLLKEQGKLSVDDPITKYFPDYTKAQDVTVKELLNMRSGIRNHLEGLLIEYELSENATKEENYQIILDWLKSKELMFEPDTRFTYSNGCFLLLSIIVEKVSGQNYSDFIKENIFTPLGMNNSGFYEDLINHPDLAEYIFGIHGFLDPKLKGVLQGAGDIVSNAKDMDKWLTSLREYTILSKESVAEMATDYSPGNLDNYGYGVFLTDDAGIWHGGFLNSYVSVVITYPENGYNVLLFTNNTETTPEDCEVITFEIANELKNLELCGDVNCDGKVDIMDATAIQKHLAGLITLTDAGYAVADVDSTGIVNVVDATAIQKYLAGLDTNLTIGEFVDFDN